ncbi:MAG: GNAT family acetyltransferase, partial [Anaerolineales bacterium]
VGTAMAGFDGHRGWVYYVAVHPDYRRQGIGSALMSEVEAALAHHGCPKLNLQIRSSNAEVQAFYESLGYLIEDRISMGKQLDPMKGKSGS